MKSIDQLHKLGQSLWYDNIQRRLLQNGELAAMINRGDIRGVTSNPSIFNNAIAKSNDYDQALKPMAWSGKTPEDIFFQLAVEDIRAAADLFLPLYQESKGGDGYVSLEVSPFLANDTQGTAAQAQALWNWVDRPNLMIKIPATPAGIPAIRQTIAAGINVNVTLIFSLERYAEVMNAFMSGLEDRLAAGKTIDPIASVASFFISRVDSKIDGQLKALPQEKSAGLSGKAAIANARLAYALFKETFGSQRFAALKAKQARYQRPLWASTSTKNPAYRDVIYIEELIGDNTVNTVPPQTLDAYRDHGVAAVTLENDLDTCRKQLAALEALGISMKKVTDELEAEGVKAFSDAFTELLGTIEKRSVEARAELGPLQSAVAARVAEFEKMNAARRMFEVDPTFWTDDTAGHTEIRKRLGWLWAPERSRALVEEIKAFLGEISADEFTHAMLLGMGGSSLAPEVMAMTFGIREDGGTLGLDLAILDSTDPAQVKAAAERSPIERTLYIVSSKSGGTAEVNAYLDYFWARTRRRLGDKAARHFIAITDPGTALDKMARERNFRHVFNADPTVGGRYSALTAFGMVPAGLLGLDVNRLLDKAEAMAAECSPEMPAARNPGLVLGAVMGEAALHGQDKLSILADPEMCAFGSWMEQLIAESSGKISKGIVPIDIEPLVQPKKYSNDRLFVYIRRSGEMAQKAAEIRKAGHPVIELVMSNEYDLSAEFYRWEVATAAACAVLQVNAFDQPDVQDNKTRTLSKIDAYRKAGGFDEGLPVWEGSGIKIYGQAFPGLAQAHTPAEVVSLFLQQVKEGDYVAINAYLPRNDRTLSKLQKLRAALLKRTGRATTLGFGPRFLHSTGQLHKGGANNGVFLQITAEPSADLDIPEEGVSFATLERAQALGDLEALLARGRRAIRVHLVNAKIEDLYQ
jgi:transaldolase/glucose-6-phosphate isomerase